MAALVTSRRCATLQEALVCKGLLEANGIHAPTIERNWIPRVSAGSWNPISMSGRNIEGFLFVIVIILVFVADRLIKPRTDTRDEAP